MESAGFKEWAIICEALGRGEQTILLRKGGIAEGRAGFAFRAPEFFLFPTFFHEQAEKTRLPQPIIRAERAGEVELRFFVRLERAVVVTEWEKARALSPLHVLQEEVVRERFEYDEAPGIHVAFVQTFRLAEPWIIPALKAYGGCRSWVTLPKLAQRPDMTPVLDEAAQARRRSEFEQLVNA